MVEAGRFGPSRKKEAATRRFANYELWVLNAAMIWAMLVGRQYARGISSLAARSNQGCNVKPRRKEALEGARKRRIWWMNTQQARRAGEHAEETKVQYRYELSRAATNW